ncbi:Hypothetical protein ACI5QM_03953 [Bacillus subtilis]
MRPTRFSKKYMIATPMRVIMETKKALTLHKFWKCRKCEK